MPKFTFRQLELFAALPEHTTLGSAAQQLHISESALSRAISRLEAALGEQLCIRRKARGMHLTPTGRHFAKRAGNCFERPVHWQTDWVRSAAS